MRRGDRRRNLVDFPRTQITAFGMHTQQCRLRELPHTDRVLEDIAAALQVRSVRRAANRHHIEIQLGRKTTVEAQFLGTEIPALLQGGKIEKAEVDRFLDLVGKVAGKDHPGNMGFDDAQFAQRVAESERIVEPGDQGPAGFERVVRIGWVGRRHVPSSTLR